MPAALGVLGGRYFAFVVLLVDFGVGFVVALFGSEAMPEPVPDSMAVPVPPDLAPFCSW